MDPEATVIDPYYPKRRPYLVITLLRIHCMQQWYCLSDRCRQGG